MVNKDVIRETFMKLESYDRINVISDILRLSNTLELEFYSSVIESILQYHKLSYNSLREELNNEDNLKSFINYDCTESIVRSKLISTLSLLKTSNYNGATHIFNFLKKNHSKFKEQAHNNPSAYDEILLIYQLANDHPAFNFDDCHEIFDYFNQIRSLPVSRDYFSTNNIYECINDLCVRSININNMNQYVYKIKVKWDHSECCINRTLEEVYHFYEKLCQLFPDEIKNGEICKLYLSGRPNDLQLSWYLLSKFFSQFLNSPQTILRCDFVRLFFKPRETDRNICDCDTCRVDFCRFQWSGHRMFDSVPTCNSPTNPSDNDEYTQSSDNKTDTSCSCNHNCSVHSKCLGHNLPLESMGADRTCSDDCSEASVKFRKKRTRLHHSTGSSPIHTPSEDSEICSKNESSRNQINRFSRQLSMVIENTNTTSSCKDIRTENWLSQSNITITSSNSQNSIVIPPKSIDNEIEPYEDNLSKVENLSKLYQCQIGNLHDWLRNKGLHKYYKYISHLNFGQFYSLTEENLNNLGLIREESKKLAALIGRIQQSDIVRIDRNIVNINIRERSNSSNSGISCLSSSGGYSSSQISDAFSFDPFLRGNSVATNICFIPNNCVGLCPIYYLIKPPDRP